jgi:hypothetical protein
MATHRDKKYQKIIKNFDTTERERERERETHKVSQLARRKMIEEKFIN